MRIAERAAPLQLLALSAIAGLALGMLVNASRWSTPDGGLGSAVLLDLALLIAACAIAAVIALRPRATLARPALLPHRDEHDAAEGPSRLLAQMHHELRTPLNAMIGFSEVMLRELHGPLGHARYQEYVAHISESGGRLLKASEDALAVAATMSALMADRRTQRHDRLPAAVLLREAWAASAAPGKDIRLTIDDGADAQIECDSQATRQALQHLLAEAFARTPPGGAIAVTGGRHRIEIAVAPGAPVRDLSARGDGLCLMLARSLIEMQGATLSLGTGPQGRGWTACIAFPASADGEDARRRPRSNAVVFPARRGGSAAGAAIRASAGSPAAPPA